MGNEVDFTGMSKIANDGAVKMASMYTDCLKVEKASGGFAASERIKKDIEEMRLLIESLYQKNKAYRKWVRDKKKFGAKEGSDTSLNEFNT